MKVVSYYNVVPKKNKSQEKFDILTKFIQGVNAAGDDGFVHRDYNLIDCDVGVIQGWQHQHGKSAQHLMLRQNVIDLQKRKNKTICTADSNLFLYANKSNEPHHYLRYSFNGVFPNTGVYFDNNPDPKRWQQISSDLNISLEPKKHKGKNILICLQRDGGWSMGKRNVVDWTVDTISKIRKHSDRTIVIRPHPKDNKAIDTYLPSLKKFYNNNSSIEFSNQDTQLDEDLNKTWAVVNHNSSSIVGPIIQGYHAFITDATTSQCAEVAHTDFSLIDSPLDFDRQQWVERISMFHWKFSELEDGSAWRHMRQYV
jgi:hypothetical protein